MMNEGDFARKTKIKSIGILTPTLTQLLGLRRKDSNTLLTTLFFQTMIFVSTAQLLFIS
jgi:hypothetical protein